MKVLIVNTSERIGGAAVAANRLKDALNNNGVKAKMLVRDKQTDDITVVGVGGGWRSRWAFMWERFCIFLRLHFSRKHLFELDIANAGHDITRLPEFREADIIHLHWINQGMLSLGNIRKILDSGKPVVWTMHDIWPATGICHVTLDCHHYERQCGKCRYMYNKGSVNDLSARVWRRKQRMLQGHVVHFVACSRWLAGAARHSGLLDGQRVESIPNPIDTKVFRQRDREESRQRLQLPSDKRLILFVAQRVTNANKGIQYLIDACHQLANMYPDMINTTGMLLLGGHAEELENHFPFPVYPLGYVSDDKNIVDVYNAADVFVMPSLSENLPNTIMEAMACGVPCVGFKVGGIPEMIVHQKTGYVARYRDSSDLADGIRWALDADRAALCSQALRKVSHEYSQSAVAQRYIEVYNEAMALKNYRL